MGKKTVIFEKIRVLSELATLFLVVANCGTKRVDLYLLSPASNPLEPVTCSQDGPGNLLLEIANPGPGQTIATTTRIEFPGRPPFLLPTRALGSNQTVLLQVPVPEGCRIQPCTVVIGLDHKGEVDDENEENNRVEFSCRLVPFKLS